MTAISLSISPGAALVLATGLGGGGGGATGFHRPVNYLDQRLKEKLLMVAKPAGKNCLRYHHQSLLPKWGMGPHNRLHRR